MVTWKKHSFKGPKMTKYCNLNPSASDPLGGYQQAETNKQHQFLLLSITVAESEQKAQGQTLCVVAWWYQQVCNKGSGGIKQM